MKVFDAKHIKNIALLGSAKSGKTTLAETMLFEAGLINRRGAVEDKNTISDYHEIEHDRGNSVYATSMHTEWRDYKINIIDTPGLDDFIGEIVSTLRVADTGVMLINAQHGVEVGTELIWNYMEQFQKPVIFAINQVDHPKANFDASLESIKQHFGNSATLMQYPLNPGEGFNAIIDLLKMTMYKFPPQGGKPEKLPIPEEEAEKANRLHNELVEKAAENDEELMELYFEKGTLDEDEMRQGLKIGMLNHQVFPIFCLSGKNDMGSGRMMGFIDNVAPGAIDMVPEKTEDGNDIECKIDGPTILFVFKTMIVPNLGKVTFFKVLSGTVQQGMELVDHQTGNVEHLNQLFIMDGKDRHPVDKLEAGDIGATLKLKFTETNHTLRPKNLDITVQSIQFPEPRIRAAVIAKSKSDHEKLGEVLHKIHQEDPTVEVNFSKELKQLIISCQGELHMSIVKWQLENIYHLDVEFISPRVPYRETIQKEAATSYRHKKQSGGAGQFGEVFMKIEPYYEGMAEPKDFPVRGKDEIELPWGGKLIFYNCIVGGVIDQRFLPAILKGVMEKMEEGPLTGSYVRDIRVMVHDGKMHPVDSNDISFKIAGMMAFKNAFIDANPKLLEPIYDMEVLVPDELMGDVMTDLQTRRSIIMGMDTKGSYQIIKAKTPLAELDKYITSLRSITQGRASFTSKFSEYAPVPMDIQKKLAQDYVEHED
ncbi:elongation factor G [Fulvivirgaceae bacterium BMA10]|uniref:Elongation factor G n=1 Tax=Splendidivirga corallicola TaxID=3051826 RepID=A0ABT8KRC3_9BACT|nr:elongation factor G [Fulvivirgaceae bacterium BMA10]